ncbi:MAG: CRTAC1 family protein [Planctomycetaceae bacterium]
MIPSHTATCLLLSPLLCIFALSGCQPDPPQSLPATNPASTPAHLHRFQIITLPPASQSETPPSATPPSTWLFPFIMAGGSAIADFNNDDLPDLLITGLTPADSPAHAAPLLQLMQQNPDGTFSDVSATAQLKFKGIPNGIATGDFNNDGLLDLCLTGYGDCRLFRNLGSFQFDDITDQTELNSGRWSTSAAFLDYDRDGWLDLFITNYVDYDPTHECRDAAGRPDFCSPAVFPRTTDRLFHNSGTPATSDSPNNKTPPPLFTDTSAISGIASHRGAGLGVATCDWNSDGWTDIFVANDGHPNFLWINQQNGTFTEEAVLRGTAADAAGQSQGSMGIAVADLDNNLLPDLVITNLDGESNAVCLNHSGSFQELSTAWQMDSASFPCTGFGTALPDLNHDGKPDFVAANGRVRQHSMNNTAHMNNTAQQLNPDSFWDRYREKQLLLLSQGNNFAQPDSTDEFSSLNAVARGLATGDVDRDGDLDLLVSCLDQPAVLLKNEMATGHWLQIRPLLPASGQRTAIGAVVTVSAADFQQVAFLSGGGSYQSASEHTLHFGLGNRQQIDQITIDWPDGTREIFPGCSSDQLLILHKGTFSHTQKRSADPQNSSATAPESDPTTTRQSIPPNAPVKSP